MSKRWQPDPDPGGVPGRPSRSERRRLEGVFVAAGEAVQTVLEFASHLAPVRAKALVPPKRTRTKLTSSNALPRCRRRSS